MGISGVSASGYYPGQAAPGQEAVPTQEEQKALRTLLEKLSADWTRRLENEKQ